MKPQFKSIGHFVAFIAFMLSGLFCLYGAFINPFHWITAGMSFSMSAVCYVSW